MPNLMYLPYIYRSDIIPLNLTERGGGKRGGGGEICKIFNFKVAQRKLFFSFIYLFYSTDITHQKIFWCVYFGGLASKWVWL